MKKLDDRDDLWPISLELTTVIALVILPFVGWAMGVASASGSACP